MAAIDDLIKKARAITENENKVLVLGFQKKFEEIKKKITYNALWAPNWHTGPSDIIFNHEHRLMLEHGDMVKFIGPHDEKYIAIGTHFGTALLVRHFQSSVNYITTYAFAEAWGRGYDKRIRNEDMYDIKAPHFLDVDFFTHVDELAELEREAGRSVGDGIPLYVPPKKVKPVEEKKWAGWKRTHNKPAVKVAVSS